jgi:hypothetical protein
MDFFKDPDRLLLAYYGALVARGRRPRCASILAACVKQRLKPLQLTTDEFHKVNRARSRTGKRLISSRLLLSLPKYVTLEGSADTIRKKFARYQGNPIAADWLRIMVYNFVIAEARADIEQADWRIRREMMIRMGDLGSQLEDHMKRVYRDV